MSTSQSAQGIYGVTEVGRMLRLAPAIVRAFARAGLPHLPRGPRGHLRFSFRDLVLLRAARDLMTAHIPASRVCQVLQNVLRNIPAGESPSAVRMTAIDGRVVVRVGGHAWDGESGQARFEFASEATPDRPRRIGPAPDQTVGELEADEWFELGMKLEPFAPAEARESFRRCLELRPHHARAHVEIGRLLHENGELQAALEHHRLALATDPSDPDSHYQLGVALDSLGRVREAMRAWRTAVRLDPKHSESWLSLAIAADRLGNRRAAMRYLDTYQDLV